MANYSTTTIGLMPRLLLTPATAAWTVPFGAYLILLSGRVVYLRLTTKTFLGDHIEAASPPAGKTELGGGANKTELGKTEFSAGMGKKKSIAENPDRLFLETRCYANYMETVPTAMIFSLIAELNGADHKTLSYALGAYFMLKIAHIEFGLRSPGTMGVGRPIGYYGAQTWLACMAGYCAYLTKDYWMA
ncbi:uncharacterized protein H6S33_003260 [Morchella sextelata]|uniref:uncharacterized protein n=1 Tax=Morchella sextelata TaxID=1174677 RepID=UPI001D05746F|nr:uncharacterized protein H6S33_003260 [Morchella sextelata]KAH0607272.1 hypothetical protein H6S33_003260 [Morchella sextelata]